MKSFALIILGVCFSLISYGQNKEVSADTLNQIQQVSENEAVKSKKVKPQRKFYGFSFHPKVGVYNAFSRNAGLMAGLETNLYDTRKTIYSIDYYYSAQYNGPQYSNQVNMAIGKFYQKKRFYAYAQAGLGYIWGDSRTNSADVVSEYSSINMPLKAGVKIMPLKKLSIGLDLYGNLNFGHVSFSPLITIGIGRLSIQ